MPSPPTGYTGLKPRARAGYGTILASIATTLLVACGPGAAEPPRLSGHYGPRAVEVSALRRAETRPDGASQLGDIQTRCRAETFARELDHVKLADVECSEDVLLRALYERAAEVGGDLVIAPSCEREQCKRGFGITCRSGVARSPRSPGEGAKLESLPPLGPAQYALPEDAFRVEVAAQVVASEPPRAAREPDRVAELAFVPVGRIVRADIVAVGDRDAGRDAVRYAVRAAAGRLGATEVVGVACTSREHGFLCLGRATRPEMDE